MKRLILSIAYKIEGLAHRLETYAIKLNIEADRLAELRKKGGMHLASEIMAIRTKRMADEWNERAKRQRGA